MGKIGKIFRTVKHLKPIQVWYQIWYRAVKVPFKHSEAPEVNFGFKTNWIEKPQCFKKKDTFEFLNLEKEFTGWDDTTYGMLWAYNLNYMDWLGQECMSENEKLEWIDRFITDIPANRIGLDPYPIALRSINWIKFFSKYPEFATKVRLDSLYSQVKHLDRKLEYHLLGNHLLEDAFALYIAGNFFEDERLRCKATKLLKCQLAEQILPDGAHYEQSPMYHCIMLDRLLDCINFDRSGSEDLRQYASKMLGHLKSIIWADGSLPLLNDSAEGISPSPAQLFNYAQRLGLKWKKEELNECGYRKLTSPNMEAIVDIGEITAAYQPGHSHADTFNYELRVNGKPFVVDTGISTYEKNARRQYERSTPAHNTVSVESKDSCEVWGGFRVGRRNKVTVLRDSESVIQATHNGFGNSCPHTRTFEMTEQGFKVTDILPDNTEGVSFIHLSPDVVIIRAENGKVETSLSTIAIDSAGRVEIVDDFVSREYNKLAKAKVLRIHFKGKLTYTIC